MSDEHELVLRLGKRHGAPWLGLNERIEDSVLGPQEASSGYDWRVNRGVIETRPGNTLSTSVTRPTAYYAVLSATGAWKHPAIDAYQVVNQRERWTWILSLKTPSTFPAEGWLLHRRVTIGTVDHDQGLRVNASGRLEVVLVDSAGGDKSFNSGSNVLAPATNYVIQVSRYDTEGFIYFSTETQSPDVESAMGYTAVLGETDHPDDDAADNDLNFSSEHDGATTYSNYLTACEWHQVTLLNYFVDHVEFGWVGYADPLDLRCALHLTFADASGHLTDHSANANDSDDESGITYRETSNAFVEPVSIVQQVAEFTDASDNERIVTTINGTIAAAEYHV